MQSVNSVGFHPASVKTERIGKRSKFTLSDGTKVWLNTGSKFIFPQKFTGNNRKVILEGDACFDVYKNKDNPFIVTMDKMNITVLGTEFKKWESASKTFKYSFNLKLVPNQKAVYNKTDNSTNIESNVNTVQYTSWKEGLIEFDRQSIVTVFNKLSRFYNVSFETEAGVELSQKIHKLGVVQNGTSSTLSDPFESPAGADL